jgi:hypothetical protein
MKIALCLIAWGLQEPARHQDDSFGPVTFWDGEYLVAEVRGASGTYDQVSKMGAVRGGRVSYYTKPRSADDKSRKVMLEFPTGEIDGKRNRFILPEGAVAFMDDGTRIEAQQLEVDYALQRLTSTKPVRLSKPGMVLTGSGLEADDTIRQMVIPGDGFLEILGQPRDLVPDRPPRVPAPTLVTRLLSKGPLTLRDIGGPERLFLLGATGGATFERSENGEKTRATADSLVVYFTRRDEAMAPVSATGRGAITVVDSRGTRATASSLDWEYREDIVHLRDVDFTAMGQRVKAKRAAMDRRSGLATFTGDLAADVAPAENQPPLHIVADLLEIAVETVAKVTTASSVVARGAVHIEGDFGPDGQRQHLVATGAEFAWDAFAERGRLTGAPFARITQGRNVILAPLLVFEGSSRLVLKGPKRVNISHEAPPPLWLRARNRIFGLPPGTGGRRVDVALVTDADIEFDNDARLVSVLGRCDATTPEFSLSADRLFLHLSKDGSGLEDAKAFGDVRASAAAQGAKLAGDVLTYLPDTGVIEVVGAPRAMATIKDVEVTAPWLRYDQRSGSVTLGRHR